jgi:hypothetical protein
MCPFLFDEPFCKIHTSLVLLLNQANANGKSVGSVMTVVCAHCLSSLVSACLHKCSLMWSSWKLGLVCSFMLHSGHLNFVFISVVSVKQHNTTQNYLSFQGPVLCFKTENKLNFLLQEGLTHESMIHRSHNFLQQNEGNLLLVHDTNQFAKKLFGFL